MAFASGPRTRMNATLLALDERDIPDDTLITTNPFTHTPQHVVLDDGTVYDRREGARIDDLISDWSAETRDLNEQIGGLKCENKRLHDRIRRLESALLGDYHTFRRFLEENALDKIEDFEASARSVLSDLGIEVDE